MFQNTKQIILKVTRGCNIACQYCYVYDKPSLAREEMSDEMFDFIIRRWLSETRHGNHSLKENDDDENTTTELSLVLHGGEPLIIGKQKFARFLKKASQYAESYGKKINLSVQTNLTLIDDDWASIFSTFGVSVGVSFDGINQKNDLRDNSSSKVADKLVEFRKKGTNVGPLMVLHKGNIDSVYDSINFLQSNGFTSIKINRGVDVRPEENGDYELSAEELLDYSEKIMNFMFKNEFKEMNLFNQMNNYYNQSRKMNGNRTYNFRPTDHCYSRYCGGMKNLMEIEPDGTFQFCGRASKRTDAMVGGTVFDKDVLEFSLINQQWNFLKGRLEGIALRRCNECPAQVICDGGCIAFSHQKIGKAMTDPITCKYHKGLNKLFIKYDKEIDALMKNGMNKEENNCSCESDFNKNKISHQPHGHIDTYKKE